MNYRQTFLQALLVFCEERNIDSYKIASLSGISLHSLNNTTTFEIENWELENIWKNIVILSGDELAGLHFGATMQVAALNVVGQVIQTSATVQNALQQVCSLIYLLTDFYTMKVEEKPKTFTINFQKKTGFDTFSTSANQMGDFLIAFTLYELKGLLLKNPKPIEAGLPTYKRAFDKEYENILKCTARKSKHYFIEFDKEYLQSKIITANYEIQNLLITRINKLQQSNSLNGDFSKKIFNFLIANYYLNSFSIDTVAGNFNLSVRTLQRKLKAEGISYLQIVEEVRKFLAINYIQNSSSPIKEISSILGYSEPSGFVRAFKKWTAKTPFDYRKQNN